MWRLNLPIAVVADSGQHERGSTGNDEVEQPLGGSSKSDVQRPETSGGNFGHVDPADRTPTELKETSEQEDADESEVTGRWHTLARNGRRDADVETDVHHGGALGDGSPEQRAATTEGVGSEDEESGAGDHLYDTVDTGCEELGRVSGDAQVVEDQGSVVVDGVCSRHLLADHETDGDERALAISRDCKHFAQKILQCCATNKHALML